MKRLCTINLILIIGIVILIIVNVLNLLGYIRVGPERYVRVGNKPPYSIYAFIKSHGIYRGESIGELEYQLLSQYQTHGVNL